MGDKLNKLLALKGKGKFDTFYMIVAYVRTSGVAHLEKSIEQFRTAGGCVKAIVGIDQGNTSVQGLRLLLPLCDELYVYHNSQSEPKYTFHPKLYAFKNKDRAIVFVGSSNLTEGGLYTNYEINCCAECNLKDKTQIKFFQTIKRIFKTYSTDPKLSKRLTGELIEKLKRRYLSDETKAHWPSPKKGKKTGSKETFFGGESFSAPLIAKIPSWRFSAEAIPRGRLLWRKRNLPSSDAQLVQPGTSPTGGLRLTQAGWPVGGKRIDQTKYFRNTVFGKLTWKTQKIKPKVEVAKTKFRIIVDGRDRGEFELGIRHKPSGEGGQHNYTTLLSWSGIGKLVRKWKLIGKDLLLYGPSIGDQQPYQIVVE
jgi:HKD family nuclease